MRRFERRAAEAAAVTLVVSDRERTALAAIAPTAVVTLLPNGVDVAAFTPSGPPSIGRGVVFCGVFNYEPNEAGALWLGREVWPLVKTRHPDATLTLVGMSPTSAVQALAVDPSIQVTGAVPDVRQYLWNAAASVAPLAVARGLQNKVLEALAAGLPCVVTPPVLEGLPPAARGGCTVAGDAPAFASSIADLLGRSGQERRLMAARSSLHDLTWERQMAELLPLIERAGAGGLR